MGSAISSIVSWTAGDECIPTLDPKEDLLFSIYLPDMVTRQPGRFRDLTYVLDVKNQPTSASPPYSPSEQLAVELWRQQVGRRVEARVALYRTRKPDIASKTTNQRPCQRTEHTVFQIPELLDIILQFAGPRAQIRALLISTAWRTSAISVIGNPRNVNAFRSLPACAPKEYGNIIDWDGEAPLRPSADEVAQFGLHVARILDRRTKSRVRKFTYFPAYFAQSPGLPDTIAHALNNMDVDQRDDSRVNVQVVSRDVDLFWLDLSQFQVNPYFEVLFSEEDRFQNHLGRWEISLRAAATIDSLLLDTSAPNTLLLRSIRSMQIVHPPCKSLGIYHFDPSVLSQWGTYALSRRVRRDEGIRIGDLLGALHDAAPALLSSWLKHAEQLGERIKHGHWIDDLWRAPGTPKFRIHLDSTDMLDEISPKEATRSMGDSEEVGVVAAQLGYPAHITRRAYLAADPFRATREGEWVPEDLFEPMESETLRHPINWNI